MAEDEKLPIDVLNRKLFEAYDAFSLAIKNKETPQAIETLYRTVEKLKAQIALLERPI